MASWKSLTTSVLMNEPLAFCCSDAPGWNHPNMGKWCGQAVIDIYLSLYCYIALSQPLSPHTHKKECEKGDLPFSHARTPHLRNCFNIVLKTTLILQRLIGTCLCGLILCRLDSEQHVLWSVVRCYKCVVIVDPHLLFAMVRLKGCLNKWSAYLGAACQLVWDSERQTHDGETVGKPRGRKDRDPEKGS